jgi:hypothetical protein
MYSLFYYICSTCFGCYLHPSSGAQTAEYSCVTVCVTVMVCEKVDNPFEQVLAGHSHTFSNISAFLGAIRVVYWKDAVVWKGSTVFLC